jgi:hypothetical protein
MNHSFNFDQENLGELCQDRELKTYEIFEPNDYYGQAAVLKGYLGLPKFYGLKAVLQHGLVFDDFVWDAELNANLPVFFSPSLVRAKLFQSKTYKPCVPIGFGFLYAMKLFQKRFPELESLPLRSGTIAFPSHSTHHIKANFNFEEYSEILDRLPDKFKPVVVCIYWRDFLLNRHQEYLKRGFKVVSAGHIYDPLFSFRFYDICRQFKYATSNDLGTHLFASVKSGCSFFYAGVRPIQHDNPDGMPFVPNDRAVLERTLQLFGSPQEAMNHEQINFVDLVLGTKHFRSRRELWRLVIFSEICDKVRWNFNVNRSFFPFFPSFFHPKRMVTKGLRRFAKFLLGWLRNR